MITVRASKRSATTNGAEATFIKDQRIGGIYEKVVPALLRFLREAEAAVGVDIDVLNWVHLKGNL